MTTELTMLLYAVLLAVVQLFLYAIPGITQTGTDYAAGPRDKEQPITGVAGRLKRAYFNHIETLPLFAIAVFAAHITGASNGVTALAAQAYLAARIAYVPAYAFGLPWIRSLIWFVALAAIVVIVFVAL